MTQKENHHVCDVMICGGGVPGLALSLLLGRLGLRVVVVDPVPPAAEPVTDSRTSALMVSAVNIMRATGAWADCLPYGAALETLRIVDAGHQVDFQASEIGQPFFGVNMPNGVSRTILARHVRTQSQSITFLCPASLRAYESDDMGVTATLTDDTTIRARLLVGADGRNALTRTLAGIELWERDYGQNAITAIIDHSRSHDHISTEFHRSGGPFTLVPLPGQQCSVVWVEYAADAERFMTLRRDDFETALQERTESMLGKISLVGSPTSWPLKAMRAKTLTAPRLALVAEAAHVLHPLGAQGLNLSLRDIAVLAEEIADAARCGLDIGSKAVLDRYEFRRRADVFTRSLGTDSLNRMVSNDVSLLKTLRGAGLQTVKNLPPLRRFAMSEGVNPGYDDSRLAIGKPL